MSEALSYRDEQLLRKRFPDPDDYAEAYRKIAEGEPLAYVLGEWYFYDEVYTVSPACLIPRPETEHLVEKLITTLPLGGIFADLCTGSGCIAISVLAHRPDLTAIAIDLSEDALRLAQQNAVRNGVADRIDFRHADVLSGTALAEVRYDAIVSNPPYIATAVIDTLDSGVRREPHMALDGGEDGLSFYRILLTAYPKNLKNDGFLLMEIGYDQGDALRSMGCTVTKDYSGNDRVAYYRPTERNAL